MSDILDGFEKAVFSDNEEENGIEEQSENNQNQESNVVQKDDFDKPKKVFKRGVVYLSFIPPGMSPTLLRNLLSRHAPVGRIYLQVVKQKGPKGKVNKGSKYKQESFTEGWVEFLKKRHAKQIAELLNNSPIGGSKKSRLHDYLWNLKYLPRFKWVHLIERLNYEKAVLNQRMRNEVSQAKRIAGHFKDMVDKEERIRKKKRKEKDSHIDLNERPEPKPRKFEQKETLEEKKRNKKTEEKREDFLKSLFS